MNTSKLVAKAHISQSEAVQLKVGNEAELQLAGLDEPIKGKVMLISPALDPGSTTIEVWVEAIKPNPALKPGMSVQINAIAKSVDDAFVVPASTVYKTPEGADFVMVAGSDEKAHQTKVKVGIRTKELAEIESGLKEKDPVITVGGYALPDGTKIKIEETPPAEAEPGREGADGKEGPAGNDTGKDGGEAGDKGDSAKTDKKSGDKPAEKPAEKPAQKPASKPAPAKGKE